METMAVRPGMFSASRHVLSSRPTLLTAGTSSSRARPVAACSNPGPKRFMTPTAAPPPAAPAMSSEIAV
jgi:hypothetical protein